MRFFQIVYGLMTFYSRYELSFASYLSFTALIFGLLKMPYPLDLLFYFRVGYSRGNLNYLRGVIIIQGIITLGNLDSLVYSDQGVLVYIVTRESIFTVISELLFKNFILHITSFRNIN